MYISTIERILKSLVLGAFCSLNHVIVQCAKIWHSIHTSSCIKYIFLTQTLFRGRLFLLLYIRIYYWVVCLCVCVFATHSALDYSLEFRKILLCDTARAYLECDILAAFYMWCGCARFSPASDWFGFEFFFSRTQCSFCCYTCWHILEKLAYYTTHILTFLCLAVNRWKFSQFFFFVCISLYVHYGNSASCERWILCQIGIAMCATKRIIVPYIALCNSNIYIPFHHFVIPDVLK